MHQVNVWMAALLPNTYTFTSEIAHPNHSPIMVTSSWETLRLSGETVEILTWSIGRLDSSRFANLKIVGVADDRTLKYAKNNLKMRRSPDCYPHLATNGEVCVRCKKQAYWRAFSYTSKQGSTSHRVLGICLDCTNAATPIIQPNGCSVCRICRQRSPNMSIWRESYYFVDVHDTCARQINHLLKPKPKLMWYATSINPVITGG